MPPLPLSDVGGISLLEDGDGLPVDGKDPVRSLDCAVDLAVGGIIQEHIDHIVEVSEGATDGNSIHSERAEGILVTRQPVQPNPSTPTFTTTYQGGVWLRTRMCLSPEWRDGEQGASLDSYIPKIPFFHLSSLILPFLLHSGTFWKFLIFAFFFFLF